MAEFFSIGIFPLILTLAAFRIGQKCQAKLQLSDDNRGVAFDKARR